MPTGTACRFAAILLAYRADETWNGEVIDPCFFPVGFVDVWLE
jgi:hypothetical protein